MVEANPHPSKPSVMAGTKRVAVVGFGNIGSGLVEILYEKGVAGLELVLLYRQSISPPIGDRSLVTLKLISWLS